MGQLGAMPTWCLGQGLMQDSTHKMEHPLAITITWLNCHGVERKLEESDGELRQEATGSPCLSSNCSRDPLPVGLAATEGHHQ